MKAIGRLTLYLLITGFAFSLCANASSAPPAESDAPYNTSTDYPALDNESASTTNDVYSERNNFDIASLLSLLGIGFLKFVAMKIAQNLPLDSPDFL